MKGSGDELLSVPSVFLAWSVFVDVVKIWVVGWAARLWGISGLRVDIRTNLDAVFSQLPSNIFGNQMDCAASNWDGAA